MQFDTDVEHEVLYDSLCINLDQSISTLQSNYYINEVCLAYSKIICLDVICSILLSFDQMKCTIEEYEFGSMGNFEVGHKPIFYRSSYDSSGYEDVMYDHPPHQIDIPSKWYDMSDYNDVRNFFKLFQTYKMPYVHIKQRVYVRSKKIGKIPFDNRILAHNYDSDALKIVLMRHFSPPEYIVKGMDYVLKYLITDKREEELRKIELCLKQQDFLYKEMDIVEKVVSISKVLSDDDVDGRVKIYVSNTLYTILEQQKILHEKLGIKPTIEHIDFRI